MNFSKALEVVLDLANNEVGKLEQQDIQTEACYIVQSYLEDQKLTDYMPLIWTDGDYGSSAQLPVHNKFHGLVSLGYTQRADKKWHAEISFKKSLKLGKFKTREEAIEACEKAAWHYF